MEKSMTWHKIVARMSSEWNELRRQVRKAEADVELKLVSFSKLSRSYADVVSPTERRMAGEPNSSSMYQISHSLSLEVEQLLSTLSELNNTMANVAALSPKASTSSAVHQHQAKLRDYTKEYRQIRNKISEIHTQEELFVGGSTVHGSDSDADRMDTLLRERAGLQAAHSGADSFTNAGSTVRDSLRSQNQFLSGTTRQMGAISGSFTAIDSIYAAIHRKHTRDCIILSLFTSLLICFLLYWWLRS